MARIFAPPLRALFVTFHFVADLTEWLPLRIDTLRVVVTLLVVRRVIFLLSFFLVVALQAEEKQPSLVEAKGAFAKADRELNEAWAAAKKSLEPEMFAEIQRTQREWLGFRDDRALLAVGNVTDKAAAQNSATYFTTAADLTQLRANFVRGIIAQKETSLTGRWDDGFGGTIEVVAQDARLLFFFHVVRGHTGDVGSLAGVAAWNDRIGWFSDKGRNPEKPTETNICFIRRAWKLEVVSANASYYLGKRAFFDGYYYKIATLDEKEQVKLIQVAESGVVPKD